MLSVLIRHYWRIFQSNVLINGALFLCVHVYFTHIFVSATTKNKRGVPNIYYSAHLSASM